MPLNEIKICDPALEWFKPTQTSMEKSNMTLTAT
jgi:hypothetical protein